MDNKEILAVIGKLYLDVNQLSSYAETLRNRVNELESQLQNNTSVKPEKSTK